MTKRFEMTAEPPRLIVSKQGHEAEPWQADENKIFDSNWYGANGIKWVLRSTSSTQVSPGIYRCSVNFPYTLNYIPPIHPIAGGMQFIPNGEPFFGAAEVMQCNVSESSAWAEVIGPSTCYFVIYEGFAPHREERKTNRIVIGNNPHDGRVGLWITPPNCDAGDLREPHIISSDNDYLKLHASARVPTQEHGSSGSKTWGATFFFEPLPYYPIIFFCNVVKAVNYRAIFPYNFNQFDASIPRMQPMKIYKNRVVAETIPRNQNDGGTEFLFIVFRNKLADG